MTSSVYAYAHSIKRESEKLLCCSLALLLTFVISTTAYGQGSRMNWIDDHFSTRMNDRQGRGRRGGDHRPDDPQLHRFATIDGSYNNLHRVTWGVATSILWRRIPAEYSDGISVPARINGESAREISNQIFAQSESVLNNRRLTDFVWQWGQFVDHDIDLTQTHIPLEAFPIAVPSDDLLFDPAGAGEQAIFLFRSIYNTNTGIRTPREQLNLITAWIDGSNIYGSDEETMNKLRLFRRGRLRISSHETGHLLPTDEDGFFMAGDVRANEQLGLTSMHTLFMREHNRIARTIFESNPDLTDEQIFWNARKRVIAILQSITYNEFLPALLGPNALRPYRGYNDRVFPNIANSFSTGAYRFGHSMLSPQLLRLDADWNPVPEGHIPLANAFFRPDELRVHGIEPYLRGLMSQPAQEIDAQVIGDVRNFLFGPPGAGGFDLVSLNVQRGRDHGLPGLPAIRAHFGLPPINDFADISSDPITQLKLASVYDSVDDVDPWVGMLCEDHVPGASVGMTAYWIIKDQFERLRDGDRFFYENQFSGAGLDGIRRTRLSDVIRRNTMIRQIRKDLFHMPE